MNVESRVIALILLPLLALPYPAQAQGDRPTTERCATREHRALDTWLGSSYQVDPEGRLLGENRAEALLDGCVVWQRWHGASGGVGASLNAYDRASRVWRHMWVNGVSVVLLAEGTVEEDRVLWTVSDISIPKEDDELERWVWTTKPPIIHRVETSRDGGESWEAVFDDRFIPWEGELPPNSRPRVACSLDREHHALAFWSGAWRIEEGSVHVGDSRVDLLVKGCAWRERGRTRSLGEYVRLMAYDGLNDVWRMAMATDRGEVYTAEGTRVDGRVVWNVETSPATSEPGDPATRWIVTPEGGGEAVRWEVQRSTNGGSWRTISTLRYRSF